MKVLSTKKLSLSQKELLLNAGLSFVEYNAIEVEFLSFVAPAKIENAIFTSQNAVKAIQNKTIDIENCFCVGPKTKALLEENGRKVVKTCDNSSELGKFIAKRHQNDTFYYFCGSERRDELPELLKEQKIHFFELKTYKIDQKPRKIDQNWAGILFFSPSSVQSYLIENEPKNTTAFCIGSTTASEAEKHFSNTIIANATTIESVIAKAAKILKNT